MKYAPAFAQLDTAVVNHDSGTLQFESDSIPRANKGAHILIGTFRPGKLRLSVSTTTAAGLISPRRIFIAAIRCGGELDWNVNHEKRNRFAIGFEVLQSECLASSFEPSRAFEHQIDDRALLDAPPAIFPAESDVHYEIKNKKCFAAFRRPPYNGKPAAWNEALNKISSVAAD